jgi:hypothetical protein
METVARIGKLRPLPTTRHAIASPICCQYYGIEQIMRARIGSVEMGRCSL